jgi:hypothetical protein
VYPLFLSTRNTGMVLRSFRCLDMKKRRRLFQNLRRSPGRRNGQCLADIARFLCCYSLVCAAPFSAALKNIDFTGFSHVFLWQRP